jgi:hypothetical protein
MQWPKSDGQQQPCHYTRRASKQQQRMILKGMVRNVNVSSYLPFRCNGQKPPMKECSCLLLLLSSDGASTSGFRGTLSVASLPGGSQYGHFYAGR